MAPQRKTSGPYVSEAVMRAAHAAATAAINTMGDIKPIVQEYGAAVLRSVADPGAAEGMHGGGGAEAACTAVSEGLTRWAADPAVAHGTSEPMFGGHGALVAMRENCEALGRMLKRPSAEDSVRVGERALDVALKRARESMRAPVVAPDDGAQGRADDGRGAAAAEMAAYLLNALFASRVVSAVFALLRGAPFFDVADVAREAGPYADMYITWPIRRVTQEYIVKVMADVAQRMLRFAKGSGAGEHALRDAADLSDDAQAAADTCKRLLANCLIVRAGMLVLAPLLALRERVGGFLAVRLWHESGEAFDRSALARVLKRPWAAGMVEGGTAGGCVTRAAVGAGRSAEPPAAPLRLSQDGTFLLQTPQKVHRLFQDAAAEAVRYMEEAQRMCTKDGKWTPSQKERVVVLVQRDSKLAEEARRSGVPVRTLAAAGVPTAEIERVLGVDRARAEAEKRAECAKSAPPTTTVIQPVVVRSAPFFTPTSSLLY